MGKCALKRTIAGCACKAVVESAAKAIGVSKLKREQGLAACSFVRGNGIFRFTADGLYGKSYLFCPPSTSFDSVRGDTGLCISPLTVNTI